MPVPAAAFRMSAFGGKADLACHPEIGPDEVLDLEKVEPGVAGNIRERMDEVLIVFSGFGLFAF